MTDEQPTEGATVEPVAVDRRVFALRDLYDLYAKDAEAAHAAHLDGVPRGPVTDFPTLDKALGGYLSPALHLLLGEPGSGKSALALQIAAACGAPALFVSCEMSPLVLAKRIVARVTGKFLGHLRGELPPAVSLELFEQAAKAVPMLALYDATRYPVAARHDGKETPGILEAAQAWRDRHGAEQCLVVVDSLHSWSDANGNGFDPEYERLNKSVAELLSLAHDLGSPVLAVGEQNRGSMNADSQSAGAGTRKIEYAGDTVLSLTKVKEAKAWKRDGRYERCTEICVSKNRNGNSAQVVEMRFHGALMEFREA